MFQPYDLGDLDEKTSSKYSHRDEDGRLYRLDNLINPNPNRPNLTYEFLGVKKVWRWTKERMQEAYNAGLVIQTKPGTVPQLKRYLDEQRGRPLGDIWTDIPPINSQAAERLGYPTQKPLALLE
jgi:site-specific DNA-methyltransferase (adenine-specific)